MSRRVLMVGATSAVAQAVAHRLADRGDRLFCLARNPDKMSAIGKSLGTAYVGSYCFDFTDTTQAQTAVDLAVKHLGGIDLAFFAHGDLPDQIASEKDFQIVRHTFETNLLSVIALLLPVCDQLLQQGSGKIGVITSVAGDRGRPRNYTYGAAKGALSLYLQGMRSRLWQSGIEVYTFKMGPVDTPMTVTHPKNFSFSTVDQVARQMVKAMEGKRYQVYVPGYWAWVMLAVRNMPESLFQRLAFLSGR
ncbi:MAG: SDR family NAD(P)-dependent oxidoreductase [Synechococcales bacterium]|nr:SDR family NAD(P)-dependent oxidoreductase [Synechococcales bacterium]